MYRTDFSVSFRMPGKAVLWQMNRWSWQQMIWYRVRLFSSTSPKCLHLQPCTDQQIPIRQSLQGPWTSRPLLVWEKGLQKNMTDIWQPSTALPGPSTLIRMKRPWRLWPKSAKKTADRKHFWKNWRAKRMSPFPDRKSMSMRISVIFPMWAPYLKMMQEGSDFSEANSCIWKAKISRPKNSSSRYTNRLQKIWQAKRSLSVPWISEQTSRWITLDLTKKRTRHWDTGQSVSAWQDRRSSRPSFVPCTGHLLTDRSPLCSRWSFR